MLSELQICAVENSRTLRDGFRQGRVADGYPTYQPAFFHDDSSTFTSDEWPDQIVLSVCFYISRHEDVVLSRPKCEAHQLIFQQRVESLGHLGQFSLAPS